MTKAQGKRGTRAALGNRSPRLFLSSPLMGEGSKVRGGRVVGISFPRQGLPPPS